MRGLAGVTITVALAAALAACGGGGGGDTGAPELTRGRIAAESGIERAPGGGWRSGECEIPRIYPTRAEVVAARKAEERRDGPDGPYPGGTVVSAEHERFGVELGHEYGYCQQAIEEGLSHVGHGGVPERRPTTVANARSAIEALDFPIRLEEPPGERGVIVGRVHGSLGERFAFFLFVNRGAPEKMPGVPGYPGFGARGGLLGGGLVQDEEDESGGYIFGSRELPRRGESQAQFKQQSHIEGEVEEALCRQATNEDCGI
jgi:hypothetical protein